MRRCFNDKKNNVQNEFLQEENEILKQKLEIHMNLWDLDKQQMESDFFAVGVLFTIYFRKLCVDNYFYFFFLFCFNFVSRRHEIIIILESLFFFHLFSLSTSQAMYRQSLFSLSRQHETIILAYFFFFLVFLYLLRKLCIDNFCFIAARNNRYLRPYFSFVFTIYVASFVSTNVCFLRDRSMK